MPETRACALTHPDLVPLNEVYPPARHDQYRTAVALVQDRLRGEDRDRLRRIEEDLLQWLVCIASWLLPRLRRGHLVHDAAHDVLMQFPVLLQRSLDALSEGEDANLHAYVTNALRFASTPRARHDKRVDRATDAQRAEGGAPLSEPHTASDARLLLGALRRRHLESFPVPPGFPIDEVLEALLNQEPLAQVARRLGIHRQRIHEFKNALKEWMERQ